MKKTKNRTEQSLINVDKDDFHVLVFVININYCRYAQVYYQALVCSVHKIRIHNWTTPNGWSFIIQFLIRYIFAKLDMENYGQSSSEQHLQHNNTSGHTMLLLCYQYTFMKHEMQYKKIVVNLDVELTHRNRQ